MVSPSGGTLSLEGGCKNLGEKRVSPDRLPKQEFLFFVVLIADCVAIVVED